MKEMTSRVVVYFEYTFDGVHVYVYCYIPYNLDLVAKCVSWIVLIMSGNPFSRVIIIVHVALLITSTRSTDRLKPLSKNFSNNKDNFGEREKNYL